MSQREFEQDLQDLLDGALAPERLKMLQERLKHDPDARELYLDYVELHSDLGFRGAGHRGMRVISMESVVQRSKQRFLRRAFIGAAAAVAMFLGGMAFMISHSPDPALTFEVSPDTSFELTHAAQEDGVTEGQSMQVGSRLKLSRGTVELDFDSGVRAILRAPAEMLLVREDLMELSHGTVWVEVPSDAVGFQVQTPDFLLTDLGTEFGIVSEPNFNDEVHVFSGKVEVSHSSGSGEKTTIKAGQARYADALGRWKEITLRSNHFLEQLPDEASESSLKLDVAFSHEQFAYSGGVSDSDLLHGIVPSTRGWNMSNQASPLELNDGIHGLGFEAAPGDLVQGAWTTVGATAEYQLGLSPMGHGWDITTIQSIASWDSAGFGNQSWTVEVKPVGGEYRVLKIVNYHPLVLTDHKGAGATRIVMTDSSGVLAKGIEAIRFIAGHVAGSVSNAFVWREIDVFGQRAKSE